MTELFLLKYEKLPNILYINFIINTNMQNKIK